METTKVELTCKECRHINIADIDDEMYNSDCCFICEGCYKEQPLSYYDYYPI